MIDRYGVTSGQQYERFKALPTQGATTLTTEAAMQVIRRFRGGETESWAGDVRAAKSNAQRLARMKWLTAAALLTFTSCDPQSTEPPPPPLPPIFRILTAMDSVNAAVRDFYGLGGKVIHVYVVNFPDTLMAPYIAISLKRP